MINRLNTFCCFLVFLYSTLVCSQEKKNSINTGESIIIDKIELLAQESESEQDYTELVSDLLYFEEHPLNLNDAKEEDLNKLQFLSDKQIYHFLVYRDLYGQLITIYELQAIEDFDYKTIREILPYITVSPKNPDKKLNLKHIPRYGKHRLIFRHQRILQQRKGYITESDDSSSLNTIKKIYPGSPDKLYLKYGFNYKNRIRFGITAEKDAGEVLFQKSLKDINDSLFSRKINPGIDFLSYHIVLNDFGILKSLVIGDLKLGFGQGLTLSTGLALGLSGDIRNLRPSYGVKAYKSTDENRFLRGVGLTLKHRRLESSFFYSVNKIDARLSYYDSSDFEGILASPDNTGLHRTQNELIKKDALKVKVAGGNVNFKTNFLRIGFTAYHSIYEYQIGSVDQPYSRFHFNGKNNLNGGFDYQLLLWKFNFFGELSMSKNGGFAHLHGLSATIHPSVTFSLIVRQYKRDYQNFYSNAFSRSYNNNEEGIYFGIQSALSSKLSLIASVDSFKYPWLRFSSDRPSFGNQSMIKIDYALSDRVNMIFRFTNKNYQMNRAGSGDFINPLIGLQRSNFRFHIDYIISPTILMSNRVECVFSGKGDYYRGTGYIVYHDVKWTARSQKVIVNLRYVLFDTDSYDERIYAYERDVLYAFSVPAYYYRGARGLVLIKYDLNRFLKFWFRYTHHWYNNRNSIGSGYDLIDGNELDEFKLQVMVKI